MGKYDLVEQVLAELQAEFFFTGAQIQPGKPVVFGRCPMDFNAKEAEPAGPEPDTKKLESGATTAFKYFLGLPGNPVSTMVTFELFGRPLINALSGAPAGKLRFVQARLKSEIRTRTGLTRFLPAILTGEYHRAEVELVPWKGSGDIAAQARANCYIVVPRDRDHIFADGMVDVLLA
jgi:molybdopterin molybdotransferase